MAFFAERHSDFVKKTYILSFLDFYFVDFRSVKFMGLQSFFSCAKTSPLRYWHLWAYILRRFCLRNGKLCLSL